MPQSPQHSPEHSPGSVAPPSPVAGMKGIQGIFKPYKGDLFGTNGNKSGGLLYLSRMNVDEDPARVINKAKEEEERKEREKNEKEKLDKSDAMLMQTKPTDSKSLHLRDKKRRFAISLATLASNPKKQKGIVEDGAIVTLVKLAKVHDRQTQLSCAAAFNSLATEPDIRRRMIQEGAVTAIVHLSHSSLRKIKNDCARALCNLAATDGNEEDLVRYDAVASLLAVSSCSIQLMGVVLMALLNLSCVEKRYTRIDEVNDAIIHLAGFSLTPFMEKMLVSCICNLTALKNNQARLVEEGCVRLLTRIQKNATLPIQRMCATAFCNLSSCSRSRGKMTDQRVVETLLKMIDSNDDDEIKRQCASTVSRLAMDVACREKVIQQHAVEAIVKISLNNKSSSDPKSIETDRVCASALNVLSLDGDSSEKLIKDGAVQALLSLIKMGDKQVRTDCAHCLCMLFKFENGINKMIDEGAVHALINLADPGDMNTSGNCALALYNLLSHEEASRVAGDGILSALVNLSHADDITTKTTCAAAMWELTLLPGIESKELIPALIKMLREATDSQIKGDCAAALYNLAHDADNCKAMMQQRCLEPLLTLVSNENFGTRVQCGAILSRLSFDDDNRVHMSTTEFIRAIFSIAELEPDPNEPDSHMRVLMTQQRMINAMYNISCDKDARPLLLSEGAAQFLTEYQTKPAENIRRACAATLCNLLLDEGTELSILDCGAVSALLITALVASDKEETKKICTKCLYNLLSEEKCHKTMVDEGVLWGFAALCKSSTDSTRLTDDVNITRICGRVFCNLAGEFGEELAGSTACVKTLLWLMVFDDMESQEYALKGFINLLNSLNDEYHGIPNQSIRYLKRLCSAESEQLRGLCILAFCMISQFSESRGEMRDTNAIEAINFDVAKHDPELTYTYVSTICNMAMDKATVGSVTKKEVLLNLFELSRSVEMRTVLVVARAIYYCTCERDSFERLTKLGIVGAMRELLVLEGTLKNIEMQVLLSSSMFNLSTESSCHLDIVNDDAIELIRALWENGQDNIKRVCALSTANLSCGTVNSAKIVGQRGTSMIVQLALNGDLKEEDGMWCVAALRNLLSTSANHRPMLKEGVVDALVKLAESSASYISLNAAAALRTMTYNQATRAALIEKKAIDVIIEDTSGKDDDDDLQIGNGLLQKIEAESWANGSRGIQREGRAADMPAPELLEGLSHPEAVLIEVPMLLVGWDKVEHRTVMEQPPLERSHTKGDHGSGGNVGSGSDVRKESASVAGGERAEKSKEIDVEVKMPTKMCPKVECEVVHEPSSSDSPHQHGHKPGSPQSSTALLSVIHGGSGGSTGKLPETVYSRRKIMGDALSGDGRSKEEMQGEALVLPSILLTPKNTVEDMNRLTLNAGDVHVPPPPSDSFTREEATAAAADSQGRNENGDRGGSLPRRRTKKQSMKARQQKNSNNTYKDLTQQLEAYK